MKVHDFIDPAPGKANPYGVYDTSAFAVNTIRSWRNTTGRYAHPDATRLLITADGGGSNGYRTARP